MTEEKIEKIEKTEKTEKNKRRRPGPPQRRKPSRRYNKAMEMVDSKKRYELIEGITLLKNLPSVKFDETVEIVMKLGIDTRKSDQLIRGSVGLPKGIGKKIKLLVFAEGEFAKAAEEAGADVVGGAELVEKIQRENWLDFDVALAHPSMMRHVGKLGRVLGPKGKMPTPKSGTVVEDISSAVKEFKAGKVEYRADSGGNVHAAIGKKSFSVDDLIANIEAFVNHIRSVKPPGSKGTYVQNVAIASTMGPGISLDIRR